MPKTPRLTTYIVVLALAAGAPVSVSAQTATLASGKHGAHAGATPADHRRSAGHGGHRGGSGHSGRGHGEMFRTIFDAVDTDGDQNVTAAEIDAYRAEQLAEVDATGDGSLTIEEFDTLYRKFTRSRMVDLFQELDADGDGVISPEEMDKRIARLVERLDRNGDGELTLQRAGKRND